MRPTHQRKLTFTWLAGWLFLLLRDMVIMASTFPRVGLILQDLEYFIHPWRHPFRAEGFFFVCLRRVESFRLQNICVERIHPPLTELNQCAFPCDSYLMFEPSRQQRCTTTLRAFVLRTKPHFSNTPFFVSVWYKGQVVQFEQKAEISTKKSRYRKKFRLFCLSYAIFIAIKSVYLARIIGSV